MKKGLKWLITLFLASALAACGNKEETKVYEGVLENDKIRLTLTIKGDEVLKQVSENTFNFDAMAFASEEEKQAFIREMEEGSAENNAYEGITDEVKVLDEALISTTTYDFTKINFRQVVKYKLYDTSLIEGEGDARYVSFEKMRADMQEIGFEEVK